VQGRDRTSIVDNGGEVQNGLVGSCDDPALFFMVIRYRRPCGE
jgi:hypothetical protein